MLKLMSKSYRMAKTEDDKATVLFLSRLGSNTPTTMRFAVLLKNNSRKPLPSLNIFHEQDKILLIQANYAVLLKKKT